MNKRARHAAIFELYFANITPSKILYLIFIPNKKKMCFVFSINKHFVSAFVLFFEWFFFSALCALAGFLSH